MGFSVDSDILHTGTLHNSLFEVYEGLGHSGFRDRQFPFALDSNQLAIFFRGKILSSLSDDGRYPISESVGQTIDTSSYNT